MTELCDNAFMNAIKNCGPSAAKGDKWAISKIAKMGVKSAASGSYNTGDPYKRVEIYGIIMGTLGLLTPEQFTQNFPVDKRYDGKKYGIKDYFSTIEALKEYPLGQPIGEKIQYFLWEYMNVEIHKLLVCYLSAVDDLRRSRGQMGVAEEFFENIGVSAYREYENEVFINKTGHILKAKKKIPRYLRLISK